MLLLASTELVPALVGWLYDDLESARVFLISATTTATVGLILVGLAGKTVGELYRREGILIVVGGWVLASVFGCLPYVLSGALPNFVDALFEAASGFTTTGATVLVDIEAPSRAVLFWRCFTQWLGGMGIIVLFVALLPELGPGARFLYKLEVPGPTAEALHPRIHDTAAILWKIYLGLTVIETGLLMMAGLDLYDALTHTFSTLSTGGFSPRAASTAAFSPLVQTIIIFFMYMAGANFSLYYGILTRRSWSFFRDSEFRLYTAILLFASLAVGMNLWRNGEGDMGLLQIARDSMFQVVSITTTTGFATADFEVWPVFSQMLLVALMFVGGCAGSTAGSMKVMRMVVGIKSAFREVRLIFNPNTVYSVFVSGRPVPNAAVRSVAGFFILYLSTWAIGSLILSFSGADLITCATAAAATLGNIGPGLNLVGPTDHFGFFAAPYKLLMIVLMWLGRLEVYAIAAMFSRTFWQR